MMGVEQAGITETIQFVLSKYPAEIQNKLTQVKVDFIFLPLGDSDDWHFLIFWHSVYQGSHQSPSIKLHDFKFHDSFVIL